MGAAALTTALKGRAVPRSVPSAIPSLLIRIGACAPGCLYYEGPQGADIYYNTFDAATVSFARARAARFCLLASL